MTQKTIRRNQVALANPSLSEKTIAEYENDLVRRIDELSYIINGLENYGPYSRVVEMFKVTRTSIDDNWHLIADPVKISELRMTKYAVNTLIDYIPSLKQDLEKLQVELVKLQNPDDVINKDVDND